MGVLPTIDEVRAERCRRNLGAFIEEAWPVVEPATPFVSGWHIEAITDHLEAAARGEITRLVINIPPRHMKSLQVAVFWPAWIWLSHPEKRFLFASYAQGLSNTHSVRCRRLITSRGAPARPGDDPNRSLLERIGYRGLVELLSGSEAWTLAGDQNLKQRYENTRTGFRLSTSVGGTVTGEGGDFLILDDPHKPEEASSDAMREKVLDWHDQTWTTRLNDAEKGVQVIVMQRLHERDLTGHVLERGGFEHLCLPAEYEPKHPFVWPDDPREEAGEVLWKKKWAAPWLREKNSELGSYGYAGQYQQRPSPAEGGIFKRDWWQTYTHGDLPRIDEVIESWDMAFKATEGSDYVVGQLWGRNQTQIFLLAQIRDRLDFTQTVQAVKDLAAYSEREYPSATRTCMVEEAANGAAAVSSLRNQVPALIAVRPDGGKESRAHAVTPLIEAGQVFLPEGPIPRPAGYALSEAEEFLEETAAFPNGAYDDQVDAMTQALKRMNNPAEHRRPRGGPKLESVLNMEL